MSGALAVDAEDRHDVDDAQKPPTSGAATQSNALTRPIF